MNRDSFSLPSSSFSASAMKAPPLFGKPEDVEYLNQMTTEAYEEMRENDVKIGHMPVKIVGLRYYKGVTHQGEWVALVREPSNQYDSNAIRVNNMAGIQVGHVNRDTAAKLRIIMDDRSKTNLRHEAIIPDSYRSEYDMTIHVVFYSMSPVAKEAIAWFQKYGMRLVVEPAFRVQAAAPPPREHSGQVQRASSSNSETARKFEVQAVVTTVARANTQQELDALFDKLSAETPCLKTENMDVPPTLLTSLMQHQKEGINWMLAQERKKDDTLPALWSVVTEQGRTMYLSSIGKFSRANPRPRHVLGGLVADEMGLGKTIQAIALILMNPGEGVNYYQPQYAALPPPAIVPEVKPEDTPSLTKTESDAASASLGTLTPQALKKMKVGDLRRCATDSGIDSTGKKVELLERLSTFCCSSPATLSRTVSVEPPPVVVKSSPLSAEAAPPRPRRTTLIVCPTSVIHNWVTQFNTHVAPGTLNIHVYHGSARNLDPEFLRNLDVVITSYGILRTEWSDTPEGRQKKEKENQKAAERAAHRITVFDQAARNAALARAASGGDGGGDDDDDDDDEYDPGSARGGRGASSKGSRKRKQRKPQGLFQVQWHRVVLDEAHEIRNRLTNNFESCHTLDSKYRWAVTGTPLQNNADDVFSLLSFLRVEPLDDYTFYSRAISKPVKEGDPAGIAAMRLALKPIVIRRMKTILSSQLPPKTVEIHTLKIDSSESAFWSTYNTLFEAAKMLFQYLMNADSSGDLVMSNYSSILEVLLRLRQAACHHLLVRPERVQAAREIIQLLNQRVEEDRRQAEEAPATAASGPRITKEEAKALLLKLRNVLVTEGEDAQAVDVHDKECAICMENLTVANTRLLVHCGHYYCNLCMDKMSTSNDRRCPLCRREFSRLDVVDPSTVTKVAADSSEEIEAEPSLKVEEEEEVRPVFDETDVTNASAPKTDALLGALLSTPPGIKTVVFSYFTSFLDILSAKLQHHNIKFAQLRGFMTQKRRAQEIHEFSNNPEVTVFLISIKAGGVGLNLTAGSHVFVMEPWWNSAVEEQAYDRVHRIGQKRPVKIVRFIIENTIEENILKIQEAKTALAQGSMRKLSPQELRKTKLATLRQLFTGSSDE